MLRGCVSQPGSRAGAPELPLPELGGLADKQLESKLTALAKRTDSGDAKFAVDGNDKSDY